MHCAIGRGCHRLAPASAVLLLAGLLTACGPSSPEQRDDRIIARIGTSVLTLDEALIEIEALGGVSDTADALRRYQHDWIERQLLIEHGGRIGITESAGFQESMKRLREDLILEHLMSALDGEALETIEVTLSEATQFYELNREKFRLQQPWVRIRHHRASSREQAALARQGMLGGYEWPDLSKRYGIDPDLQIRQADEFVPLSRALEDIPELNRVIRRMGVMEVSDIMEHDGAWHVVQIADRREEGSAPELDWIIPEVQEWLLQEKKRRYVNAYIRTLYLESEISNRLYKRDLHEDASPSDP